MATTDQFSFFGARNASPLGSRGSFRHRPFLASLAETSLCVLLVTGCSSKPAPSLSSTAAAPPVVETTSGTGSVPVRVASETSSQPPGAQITVTENLGGTGKGAAGAEIDWKDVFFEFDSEVITSAGRDALAANAELLRNNPRIRILVEGHCDKRGTAQYNMGLGERRAWAVKSYLSGLGIDSKRVDTISYGKERPFVAGNHEAAFEKNRRGHFTKEPRDEPSRMAN